MSTVTMQEELALALNFRKALLARKPQNLSIEIYDAIEPELLKLLYAKNKDLSNLAYQKIMAILIQNLDPRDPVCIQLKGLLSDLHTRRNTYLISPSKGFLGFWAEENWAGANLAVLALPFLAATLFPPASVALLTYALAITVCAGIDVARKSPDYWLEESSPKARELTEEHRAAFQKDYGHMEVFLPENNSEKDAFKSMDQLSYAMYGMVLGIAVLGLASFLFPPIGIPVIALTALSGVAIAATAMQCYLMLDKQQKLLAEIQHEQAFSPTPKFEQHDSTTMMNHKIPTQNKAPESGPHPSMTAASAHVSQKPSSKPADTAAEEDVNAGKSGHTINRM